MNPFKSSAVDPPCPDTVIYWRHRIQMAKAMGCNTIAAYIFWNYHEFKPNEFDFTSGNRNIARFIRMCQEEGMWVLLRPGPLCLCRMGFWWNSFLLLDIPRYRIPIHGYPVFFCRGTRDYFEQLAKEVVPLQCIHGGPILMVQIENKYGRYRKWRSLPARPCVNL